MIDYEELYRKETGEEPFQIIDDGVYGKFLKREYNPKFIEWLKQQLTHKDTLLALSEARWRAAENMKNNCMECTRLGNRCPLDACAYYRAWQSAVKEYKEGVK